MTSEQLKAAVAEYANEYHPGWRVAAVSVRVGRLGENPAEMLLVSRDPENEDDTLARREALACRGQNPECPLRRQHK